MLAAENYAGAMLTAVQANTIVLPASTITFNWAESFSVQSIMVNQKVNVPATNNIVIYSDSNYSNLITTLNNVSRGSKYNQAINLGVLKEDDTVYFRFTFTYNFGMWSQDYNFTTSAKVSDLNNVNGNDEVEVTLTRQN